MTFLCLICNKLIVMPNQRKTRNTYHYSCLDCWNDQDSFFGWPPIPSEEWGLDQLEVRTALYFYANGDYDDS